MGRPVQKETVIFENSGIAGALLSSDRTRSLVRILFFGGNSHQDLGMMLVLHILIPGVSVGGIVCAAAQIITGV